MTKYLRVFYLVLNSWGNTRPRDYGHGDRRAIMNFSSPQKFRHFWLFVVSSQTWQETGASTGNSQWGILLCKIMQGGILHVICACRAFTSEGLFVTKGLLIDTTMFVLVDKLASQ